MNQPQEGWWQDPNASLPVLKIHPVAKELSKWLPELVGEEREQLLESIKEHGIRLPIVINRSMDTLIDGVNRWHIAHELKLKVGDVPWQVFEGEDEEIPNLILACNALRRHLNDDQRTALISKIRGPRLEKEAAERMTATLRKGTKTPATLKSTQRDEAHEPTKESLGEGEFNVTEKKGSVVKQIAAQAGTTEHKARQAEIARKGGTLDDVLAKKSTLRDAAAQASKPKTKDKGKPKAKPKKQVTFENEVWKRWSTWLKYWPQTQHKAVFRHVREFMDNPRQRTSN
jgi:ParB-like chromosome segregation protein Spo0J